MPCVPDGTRGDPIIGAEQLGWRAAAVAFRACGAGRRRAGLGAARAGTGRSGEDPEPVAVADERCSAASRTHLGRAMTTMGLRAYALAAQGATPALRLWLLRRARDGKEDAARLAERWGRPSAARPRGRLLWLHGVSVGESVALLSLAERARETRPDVAILATTGTRAAAELMSRRLAPGAIHQYAPLDTPAATRAFIRHWGPDLGVFVESEVWPNLLFAAKAGGVRLALLSARLSEASARRWGRVPASARAIFGAFDLILARDDCEAERLGALGAPIDGRLDLKFGAAALRPDPIVFERFRALWRARPVILAASTHSGEEELVLAAFRQTRSSCPAAILIIAPRHPDRGDDVANLARAKGFCTTRQGAEEQPGKAAVFVADTIGELGTWYALADLGARRRKLGRRCRRAQSAGAGAAGLSDRDRSPHPRLAGVCATHRTRRRARRAGGRDGGSDEPRLGRSGATEADGGAGERLRRGTGWRRRRGSRPDAGASRVMRWSTPRWWYRRTPPPPIVAAFLRPLSRIWADRTAARIGSATPVDCGAPVVCVGNLTAGGSGKTPVVIELARLLGDRGARVVILSSGYGGHSRGRCSLILRATTRALSATRR